MKNFLKLLVSKHGVRGAVKFSNVFKDSDGEKLASKTCVFNECDNASVDFMLNPVD